MVGSLMDRQIDAIEQPDVRGRAPLQAEPDAGREGEPGVATPAHDHGVGYGRPPVHTRFQPGRSGNRKGRPKGSRTLAGLVGAALDERVSVTQDGRRTRITKREAIVTQLVNKSAGADMKAMAMLIGLLQKFDANVGAIQDAAPAGERLEGADEEVIAGLLARLAAGPGGHDGGA